MFPGEDTNLSGKKLTAGSTLIRHTNGNVTNEGLYLGMAKKGGRRHLVVGQMILECITIPRNHSTEVALDDGLFGKFVSISGPPLDKAWNKLRHAMAKESEECSRPGLTAYAHKHCHEHWYISVCVLVYHK